MDQKKVSPLFKLVKDMLRLVYPKITIEGLENLPDEPCIIAANHCQMHGPIGCELYFPEKRYTWCAGEMMDYKTVPEYAFRDFWSQKPKCSHWFYKMLSYAITPLAVLIFNNASTIAVHRDMRILSTFRSTVNALEDGANVIIFPEKDEKHNHIIYNFQEGFIDAARLYQRKTKKEISLVPMYIAPKLKKMYIGKPVPFRADAPYDEEKRRICKKLMEDITAIACALPRHTVIPYRNIPRKLYPKNTPEEV